MFDIARETKSRVLRVRAPTAECPCQRGRGISPFSPGGPEEVARRVEDVDITDKAVLDVGCGIGGPSLELVRTHGARTVLGIDIERNVLKWAQQTAETAGLRDAISFELVQPGPFPLEDSSFDVVFSKEALIEIDDIEAVYAEILRVLKPGGWFVASDWLKGDGPESDALRQLVVGGPVGFNLKSLKEAAKELEVAGFVEVAVRNRNARSTPRSSRGSVRGFYGGGAG